MSKRKPRTVPQPAEARCPRCDSIFPEGADKCVMCGFPRDTTLQVAHNEVTAAEAEPAATEQVDRQPGDEFVAEVRESRSSLFFWIVTAFVVVGLGLMWSALRTQAPAVMAALIPTTTPLPPTVTPTPSDTPIPTATLSPSETPPPTGTAAPTEPPREARLHSVAAGETLFGLSLIYRITADSIAQANNIDLSAPIQSGQSLVIPWPTATPPLESVLLEINGEPVMADATNCEIITIQSGDSAYGLSALKGVPLEAIIAVNRQTQESISLLQPGDTLCIPELLYGDTIPPTPGPSPTPSLTPPPGGPALLYPVDGSVVETGETPIILQWTAVKNLEPNEWYMVELRDADARNGLPKRGFTRDQSFVVPQDWRPQVNEGRRMEWRVSIVQVTGHRSDGGFIYTFGGTSSLPAWFEWHGITSPAVGLPAASPTSEH